MSLNKIATYLLPFNGVAWVMFSVVSICLSHVTITHDALNLTIHGLLMSDSHIALRMLINMAHLGQMPSYGDAP